MHGLSGKYLIAYVIAATLTTLYNESLRDGFVSAIQNHWGIV